MRRLIIVRHAKAEKDPSGRRDFERRLAERGQTDATEMGRRLARLGLHPDAIVGSPAARALETARLIARELDFPWKEIRTVKPAYLAEVDDLLELVQEIDDRAQTAMFVGHNPGCTELAALLAKDFSRELPTCAVVALDLPADAWAAVRRASGTVRWFESPRGA